MKPSLLFSESGVFAQIGELKLDASVQEDHTASARITTNPVEDGSVVADHVVLEPETLSIDGIITDDPITYHMRPGEPGAEGRSRAIDGYQLLLKLLEERQPLTVVTGLRVYRDMVLTRVSVPRQADTGAALRFTAELTRVRIVSSQVVPMNRANKSVKDKSQTPAELGRKSVKDASVTVSKSALEALK